MEAGREAGLSEGERFTLANFSYSNIVIVQKMFHHLSSTDFIGITVSMGFKMFIIHDIVPLIWETYF